jgi:hypothetical protein
MHANLKAAAYSATPLGWVFFGIIITRGGHRYALRPRANFFDPGWDRE